MSTHSLIYLLTYSTLLRRTTYTEMVGPLRLGRYLIPLLYLHTNLPLLYISASLIATCLIASHFVITRSTPQIKIANCKSSGQYQRRLPTELRSRLE